MNGGGGGGAYAHVYHLNNYILDEVFEISAIIEMRGKC